MLILAKVRMVCGNPQIMQKVSLVLGLEQQSPSGIRC